MTKMGLFSTQWHLSLPNPCISWSLVCTSRCFLHSLLVEFQEQVELWCLSWSNSCWGLFWSNAIMLRRITSPVSVAIFLNLFLWVTNQQSSFSLQTIAQIETSVGSPWKFWRFRVVMLRVKTGFGRGNGFFFILTLRKGSACLKGTNLGVKCCGFE